MLVVILAGIVAITSLIGWISYLVFLSNVKPEHYRDVAVPVKAFRSAGLTSVAEAIMKVIVYLRGRGVP